MIELTKEFIEAHLEEAIEHCCPNCDNEDAWWIEYGDGFNEPKDYDCYYERTNNWHQCDNLISYLQDLWVEENGVD